MFIVKEEKELDNNKGQTIFLSVIGVATLLVAIIGATFAWFSATVIGNDNASSIIVTTATLGNVTFTDGAEIEMLNIRPETSPQTTKSFTVANDTVGATETLTYSITLQVGQNTLTPVADGMFVHKLVGSTSGSGALVDELTTEQIVPTSTTLIGEGTLVGQESHSYDYTIQFKESGSNQNSAQSKAFYGKLAVAVTNSGAN